MASKKKQFAAVVSSRPRRFWRAGMEFTQEEKPVIVSEETLEVLKAEPMLLVHSAEEVKAGDGGGGRKRGGGER